MENIILYSSIAAFLVLLFSGIRIVRPVEKGLIERFGKYKRTAEQGFNWIIPIIDRMIKVNITENMVDVEKQFIITKDSLNAEVDALVSFRVSDSYKAVYAVDDYYSQIVKLMQTTLRNIIGTMTLNKANSERSEINVILVKELETKTQKWGIDVINVELQRIDPPSEVQKAMNQVVMAEKDKTAAVDFANAVETEADGKRRAEIKKADGIKQSKILVAEGEAESIKLVNESLQEYFKDAAQEYKKLETVAIALKRGTKYVLDPNKNMTLVLSEVAGITPVNTNKTQKKTK